MSMMGSIAQEYEDKIAQLQGRVAELENSNEVLMRQNGEIGGEILAVKLTNAELTHKLREAEGRIDFLEQLRDAKTATILDKDVKIADLKRRLQIAVGALEIIGKPKPLDYLDASKTPSFIATEALRAIQSTGEVTRTEE